MPLIEQVLFFVHGLSGAAWFGGIFYRTLTVDPKAHRFFPDGRDYERYSVHLAHNMRPHVAAGLLVCGGSGFALVGLRWQPDNPVWVGLLVAKLVVWLAACGLFWYVSFVHWPWRSLAVPAEFPRYQRQAFRLACGMIALAGGGFVLGQACRLAYL